MGPKMPVSGGLAEGGNPVEHVTEAVGDSDGTVDKIAQTFGQRARDVFRCVGKFMKDYFGPTESLYGKVKGGGGKNLKK